MESACVANDEFPERKEQKWVLLPYAEWVEKGEERMRDGRCKKYGETPEQKVAADIACEVEMIELTRRLNEGH